jgi:hypothetical protein
MTFTPRPTITDAATIAGCASRLLTGNAQPGDLRTLQGYRASNDRDTANAARFFLTVWGDSAADANELPCDVEADPSNVVSLTVHQTRHDLAHAFRSMDAARSYPPKEGA